MATVRQKAHRSAAPAQERHSHLDWGHLRFFLELVRTGSHARAAKRMGVDRNTVARRVAALEAELGLALFERGPQGWSQTLAGRVEENVLALARHVDARDPGLRGLEKGGRPGDAAGGGRQAGIRARGPKPSHLSNRRRRIRARAPGAGRGG
jgi:hypothetical protein